jgi:uncharacterized membrane protein YgcG
MFATLPTCSTTTTQTTLKITFIVSDVLVVPALQELPSLSSPLTVSFNSSKHMNITDISLDSKQARDLVNVLVEAKQQIDPKLAEMARYGGGGGGGRGWGGGGRGRGRGGHRGGGGGGYSGSNSAPMNNSRW